MVRDASGKPLTLLQLQKDVWSKVQKISKPDLVKLIGGLNKVKYGNNDILSHISVRRADKHGIIVESKGRAFLTVRTSSDSRLWSTGKNKTKQASDMIDIDNGENVLDNTAENTQWLPEGVIQSLQTTDDEDVRNAVKEINTEFFQTDMNPGEMNNIPPITEPMDEDLPPSEQSVLGNVFVDNLTYDIEENHSSDIVSSEQDYMTAQNIGFGENNSLTRDTSLSVDYTTETQNLHMFDLSDTTVSMLTTSLKEADEFKTWNIRKLHTVLTIKTEMSLLTHNQLNRLHESLKLISENVPLICKSWKKEKKVSVMFDFVNNVESVEEQGTKRRRVRSPQSLSKLCLKVIQSRKLPKAVLNAAYASYLYPEELQKWLEQVS